MGNVGNVSEKIAPVIPENQATGHSGLVVSCPAHALPFGVIFEEYEARRGDELKRQTTEIFNVSCPEDAIPALRELLIERDKKYAELEKAKKDPSTLPSEIDELENKCRCFDRPLKQLLHRMNGSAVCLSGGGIRSASFGLGVLEGLARFSSPAQEQKGKEEREPRLLHDLDYLSTVSGGGYIGSWLTAWVYRRRTAAILRAQTEYDKTTTELNQIQAEIDRTTGRTGGSLRFHVASLRRRLTADARKKSEQEAALRERLETATTAVDAAREQLKKAEASNWELSYGEVVKALAGKGDFTSGDPAPQPVRHLREYTSYLAPAMGLSLDSWDLLAIVFRNLVVSWVMLVPMLLAVVALPQVSYYITRNLPSYLGVWASLLTLGLVLALFVVAAIFCGRKLPSHRRRASTGPKDPKGPNGPNSGWVALGFAVPVLLANWLLAQLWYANQEIGLTRGGRLYSAVFLISYVGFFTLATLLFVSYRKRVLKSSRPHLAQGREGTIRFLLMQVAAIVSALVTTELMALLALRVLPQLAKAHATSFGFSADDRLYTILAFPLITMVPMVSHSLFSGLLGTFEQEEDREWLSRAGGIQLAVIAVWIASHGVALYATDALIAIKLAVSGAVLGGIGSALGWSGATSAGPRPVKAAQLGKLGSFLKDHALLLPSVCGVALLLLTLGAAGGEHGIAKWLNYLLYQHYQPVACLEPWYAEETLAKLANGYWLLSHLCVLAGSVVLALLVNWAINVNLFSLHGMYRMRLMRAFLGASNTQRYPDAFTQFDPKDTPRETDLPKGAGVPLHVINTTLNLVGTKNLAWRQRKAASFTFSCLHSGSWRLGYVPTQVYAGADGVTLATAMAISGAAFNPNMGYHSSPLVTLLMTFFNVRLGWWLPNPAREEGAHHAPISSKGADFLHKTGPTMALEPLILEAFGMTDDTYRWIELTDGGHFENLGLYEMVLRRCHNIVVVDASADPDCQFEDLGNALRKIQIDLGIPIRFEDGIKMKKGATLDNHYCAVATIDYACADDDSTLSKAERESLAGTLIYIKAALTGDEPPDIKQYALTHPTFPHETTANQFFNESQFESYRHLGSYEIETIVTKRQASAPVCPDGIEMAAMMSGVSIPPQMDFKSFVLVATNYGRQ